MKSFKNKILYSKEQYDLIVKELKATTTKTTKHQMLFKLVLLVKFYNQKQCRLKTERKNSSVALRLRLNFKKS